MPHSASHFSPEDSLKLIDQMISQAKQDYEGRSFYFLVWGTLLFLTGVTHYLLAQTAPQYANWVWFIQGILGGIICAIYGARQSKDNRQPASHLDRMIMNVWIGFGICLFFVIFSAVKMGGDPVAFVLLVTGLPTFITGRTIRFAPLTFGGISFWIFGVAALFIPEQYLALLFSAAIFTGYLLPGILLKQNEKKRLRVQRPGSIIA